MVSLDGGVLPAQMEPVVERQHSLSLGAGERDARLQVDTWILSSDWSRAAVILSSDWSTAAVILSSDWSTAAVTLSNTDH